MKRKPSSTQERMEPQVSKLSTSAESVDYKRGEDVRLGEKIDSHLAASVKRLDKFRHLS